MKFLELSCDQSSFHQVSFNREGLSLIVGDGSTDKTKEGSSNGVGKTLALELVHQCIGSKTDARLRKAVPDWRFSLTFTVAGKEHAVTRTGAGKIWLDDKPIAYKALLHWLDESGVFYLDPSVPTLSFRSLVKRFARYDREDCVHPLRTKKEADYDGLLRSSYLLGLDCSLEVSKRNHKAQLEELSQAAKTWQQDNVLKEVFRAGAQPRVRAEWLERELPRLRSDLAKFQVAENYRLIERQATELTAQLRDLDKDAAVLAFQRRSIERSLEQHPDISKDDLLQLYSGLEEVFRPEALAHLSAVQQFHETLAASRKERLTRDLARIGVEEGNVEETRQRIAKERDSLLQSLQGKKALDEYSVLAQQIARFEEERNRLQEYLNFAMGLQQKAQTIRERRVEEDRVATDYVATKPLAQAEGIFVNLAQLLYPHIPAGIVIDNNVGDNQIRYNIDVQIEGDSSDGINDARIVCFDWLLFMHGSHHTMDVLWHDNRLFADMSPEVRAAWFSHVMKALPGTGKQYIASLNTENYDAMLQFMNEDDRTMLAKSRVLTLRGDKPENKLLGIQFGK